MTVVVDLGCADHGRAYSLGALIEEYRPTKVYGFDPSPTTNTSIRSLLGVETVVARKAAWLYDGETTFTEDGWSSRIATGDDGSVECFDFPAWLADLQAKEQSVVVKMDVEGAEFELLDAMLANGTLERLQELLVEWHARHGDPAAYLAKIPCPVREWWL